MIPSARGISSTEISPRSSRRVPSPSAVTTRRARPEAGRIAKKAGLNFRWELKEAEVKRDSNSACLVESLRCRIGKPPPPIAKTAVVVRNPVGLKTTRAPSI